MKFTYVVFLRQHVVIDPLVTIGSDNTTERQINVYVIVISMTSIEPNLKWVQSPPIFSAAKRSSLTVTPHLILWPHKIVTGVAADILSARPTRVGMCSPPISSSPSSWAFISNDKNTEENKESLRFMTRQIIFGLILFGAVILKLTLDRAVMRRQLEVHACAALAGGTCHSTCIWTLFACYLFAMIIASNNHIRTRDSTTNHQKQHNENAGFRLSAWTKQNKPSEAVARQHGVFARLSQVGTTMTTLKLSTSSLLAHSHSVPEVWPRSLLNTSKYCQFGIAQNWPLSL